MAAGSRLRELSRPEKRKIRLTGRAVEAEQAYKSDFPRNGRESIPSGWISAAEKRKIRLTVHAIEAERAYKSDFPRYEPGPASFPECYIVLRNSLGETPTIFLNSREK